MLFDEYGEIVTLRDVCDMLGIGVNTAYRLLREQKIRGFKIGSIWHIPKQAVLEYIFCESGMSQNIYA